jgi:hypothetical protein
VEKDEFLQRVANQECYETTIYEWAMRLFDKGTSLDDAITIIHRARRFILIYKTRHPFDYHIDITIENIHAMLSEYPKYNQLPPDRKKIVQQKIAKKFDHKARIEVIEQILEDMHLKVKWEKENNHISLLKITVQHIMDSIRKWNMTDYWQNKRKNHPNT